MGPPIYRKSAHTTGKSRRRMNTAKIVVIDPVILSDNDKRQLGILGELEIYDKTPASFNDLAERIKDADIILVGKVPLHRRALIDAARLKMICVCHTGHDNIDLKAATAHNIVVSNVPDYASKAVAEFVFALALDLMRKIQTAHHRTHLGKFDHHYYLNSQLLAGKTIGIIGAGNIGKRVIQIALGFSMNVISTTAHPSVEREIWLGVKFVPLNILLSESDIVTLHLPLTPETEHIIGAAELAMMKRTAFLINTSRGKLVDEEALIESLRNGRIAGAALDVFEREPLPADSPLLKLNNIVLTPHIAYLTEETTAECARICIENIRAFLKGQPQNVVNPSPRRNTE